MSGVVVKGLTADDAIYEGLIECPLNSKDINTGTVHILYTVCKFIAH